MGNCSKIQVRDELGEKKKSKQSPKKGHMVVYVGEEMSRFVVPISSLKNPQFQGLLDEAAEVYGFHTNGAIVLPCTLSTFSTILNFKLKY